MKNKNDTPFWLRIIAKFPRKWKYKIREKIQYLEFLTNSLVVDSHDLLVLIENTQTPNYEEFDRRLVEAKKTWGYHDSEFAFLETRRRMIEFMNKHREVLK